MRGEYQLCTLCAHLRIVKSVYKKPHQRRMQVVMQFVKNDDVSVGERVQPWGSKREHLLSPIGLFIEIKIDWLATSRVVPYLYLYQFGSRKLLVHPAL